MPKDYFSISRQAKLSDVPSGGKIHVIGVCGVAMAQLSMELASRGYLVSGSDKEFYEPMGSALAKSQVRLCRGYDASNVPLDAKLVVIGNAISYGHPEVVVTEEKGLPYTCFPSLLAETIIGPNHSIVVSGTHGKTTTTAMIATILMHAGKDPSYFIGGMVPHLPSSLVAGKGGVCVVEGDEYDSVFYAKVPKFDFYKPLTCIVNAIEFDHADIYPNVDAIEREFDKLARAVPKGGTVFCAIDFPRVKRLAAEWRASAAASVITFGEDASAQVRVVGREQIGDVQHITVEGEPFGKCTFPLSLSGAYNAKNAVAATLAAMRAGVSREDALKALSKFVPVKRRQEVRFSRGGVVHVEDFAHHPTAARETIKGVRERFPAKKLWAVFEPRSNTSRRKVFQSEYVEAFQGAHGVVLAEVTQRQSDTGQELLDVKELARDISESGIVSSVIPTPDEIVAYLMERIGSDDVILIMSNGSFGGINEKMVAALEKRFPANG